MIIIKSRGINDIGLHTIRKWLQSQDNYSLQKPTSKSFEKARVVVNAIDEQYDMDLADVSSPTGFVVPEFIVVVPKFCCSRCWLKNRIIKFPAFRKV
jgi:hypothetical protein